MTPTDEVTLTEELRKGLDECGVKYTTDDGRFAKVTKWLASNGRLAVYAEYDSGEVRFAMDSLSLTPTQAIAVTVGEEHEMHICKRCGVAYELNIIDRGFGKPRFCPNCGGRCIG